MSYYDTIAANPLRRDTHDLAVIVGQLVREIQSVQREYDITRQLLRSTVSIGANLLESQGAASTEMLTSRLEISYRECCESRFHLSILTHMQLVPSDVSEELDARYDSIGARLYSGIRRLRHELDQSSAHSRYR